MNHNKQGVKERLILIPFDPTVDANEDGLLAKLHELWKRDEFHHKQRYHIQWIQDGDRNSRFFHLTTIQRQ